MPVFAMLALSGIGVLLTAFWARNSVSGKVRYQPCGYRMIRPRRMQAVALTNALGIAAFGGLSVMLFGWALLNV